MREITVEFRHFARRFGFVARTLQRFDQRFGTLLQRGRPMRAVSLSRSFLLCLRQPNQSQNQSQSLIQNRNQNQTLKERVWQWLCLTA